MDNACAIDNCHVLLQAAFWNEFINLCGPGPVHSGFSYSYRLSNAEAVDWMNQLVSGTAVISLGLNDNTNCYYPALEAS